MPPSVEDRFSPARCSVSRCGWRPFASPPTDWQAGALPGLPEEESELETPPGELRDIVAQVHDLAGLYWDGDAFGERPMEDELVAHYVVPFLRALGWPVERIAIKWRNIDVCVFSALPRTPENCYYLIEAKRLGAGVEGALEQASRARPVAPVATASSPAIVSPGGACGLWSSCRATPHRGRTSARSR